MRPEKSPARVLPLRPEQTAPRSAAAQMLLEALNDPAVQSVVQGIVLDAMGEFRAGAPAEPLYLGGAALAERLGVSRTQIHRWAQQGMPCIGGGREVRRYRLTEALAWLEARNAGGNDGFR